MAQLRKSKESQPKAEEIPEAAPSKTNPEIEAHKHLSDELLDEIDALLEENAEEFVKNYQQRGGE